MKAYLASVASGAIIVCTLAISAAPALAAGCVSGAAAGGVAGHVAGHHGVLGAAAGCAVGHHEENKKAAQQNATQPTGSANATH